ncbi:MAG: hypothetical protein IIW47_04240, partial [Bacteroidales bacterium]|nr:hypothetical protein [Bacteroidales bacterium]
KGLSDKEINESRAKWGSNDLTPPARESWVKLLLGKFNDPIIKAAPFCHIAVIHNRLFPRLNCGEPGYSVGSISGNISLFYK